MDNRHLDGQIKDHFQKYKEVLILLWSRQVWKTTLVKKLFPNAIYLLVDNEPVRKIFETYDINTYKNILLKNNKSNEIVIDEIHLLSNPWRAVKIIYDQMPQVKLIITGSSSFHIKNKTSESLAWRKIDYHIYPLTFSEYLYQNWIEQELDFKIFENLIHNKSVNSNLYLFDIKAIIENILIYWEYPNILNHPQDKNYLINFVDSLIFKDLLELNLIENKKLALNLLKILAYQIWNLLNYSKIASELWADQRTIKRYIEIFEQSFIIFRLNPYSWNKKDEIIKASKIYFYDTWIRNALINNFEDIIFRNDKWALFENFIISEILKSNSYLNVWYKLYFWRTKQMSEIDLVLEKWTELIWAEIKYNKWTSNTAFLNKYPHAIVKSINIQNFY